MNHKISKRLALIALSVSSTGIFVIQAKADPVILLQNQADFSAAITGMLLGLTRRRFGGPQL